MVFCKHCAREVPGVRPYEGALACNMCGRILESFNFSTEVQFFKNANGQSQAAGNIVRSVQSGISSSRERRLRIARDEFMNLRDALGLGDERDDVINLAVQYFTIAVEKNFTKGRRTELVQCSVLYLTCREKKIPVLLIDFSSYLRVSVYELGSVYLQLWEVLYYAETRNYEKLVDPSIFIPRFLCNLLNGKQDKAIFRTARDIIASMKRDWMQTGRKPSGICGAALYTAALSHGIKCTKTDIVKIVHICEATLAKRLTEFANTDAGNLNVEELTEREREMHKISLTMRPSSKSETVHCMHQESKPYGYGLCEICYNEFESVSGGLVGGSDPPAFQRAEKERMEKAAREDNDGGDEQLNSEREPNNCSVNNSEKPCSEKGEENKDGADEYAEASDESGNFSDIDDDELDCYFHNEEETRKKTVVWEEMNKEYIEEQAAKAAALKVATDALNASKSGCPEHARKMAEDAKAAVAKSRKEKQRKRAEELKNAPPPATTAEAVRRQLAKKSLGGLVNDDILERLFDPNPSERSPKRLKMTTKDMEEEEEKKEMRSHEVVEEEEEEEGYVESYDINTNGDKLYEDEEEEEDDVRSEMNLF